MAKSLVIVESPTKAKTIGKYLGKQFVVKASLGHVKDLPKKNLSVDVEKSFEPHYEGIETPRNTPTGFVTAFFATLIGFAMIWHIWWMALLGLAGAFATFVAFAWRDRSEVMVPAAEVAALDRANRAARTVALSQPRTFP